MLGAALDWPRDGQGAPGRGRALASPRLPSWSGGGAAAGPGLRKAGLAGRAGVPVCTGDPGAAGRRRRRPTWMPRRATAQGAGVDADAPGTGAQVEPGQAGNPRRGRGGSDAAAPEPARAPPTRPAQGTP
ncbi:hypothetical protein QJS66_17170 [Kocuria rhizophila]|nr:hypothetical protein QJS66_17170 [Kocuria rhizophila]